jgi:MYXO-CTERM domain-containing protein
VFRTPLVSALATAALAATVISAPSLGLAAQAPAAQQGRPALEVATGAAARTFVATSGYVPKAASRAWQQFQGAVGGSWRATWDVNTNVPLRVYGSGIAVPGSVANASIAEQHARDFLRQHLSLLAPGSSPSDFQLVSNEEHRGIRSLGFVQTHAGMPVVGGQVSLRYKADRLVMLGSEALPNVSTKGSGELSAAKLQSLAQAWILSDSASTAKAGDVAGPMLLPIISSGGTRYHKVMSVVVDGQAPIGKWRVYLDAASGKPVAREQTLRFGDATVEYDVPLRQPLGDRAPFAAKGVTLVVDGQTQDSSDDGAISWDGLANATVVVQATGPLINVETQSGSIAGASIAAPHQGAGLWSESEDELLDAQLSAFIHARIAKDAVRVLNPGLGWLDTQLPVNVNINDACNAFSDGNSINFFIESSQCANTARLADVVYHEFGHSMHANSIIEGVGAFDGAFSEGLSDFLSASITNDPAMGVGFFKSNAPLRHIDPENSENIWPDDVAEIHFTGLIFAGAMWDLRKILIEKYGQEDGAALANAYFYGAVQRASSIPATYAEVVLEDDDDGDLSNGTPNICDINAAFGAHGLRDLIANAGNLSVVDPEADGYEVQVRVEGLFEDCPGDRVRGASMTWHLRGDTSAADEIEMTEGSGVLEGIFTGTIPSANDGEVVRYSVDVEFADGSTKQFPDNPADQRYEFYVGEIVELYCTDFETNPFEEGWTHELSSGQPGDGADDWQWGTPGGNAGSGDPYESYSGNGVVGNDLGGEDFDGKYQPEKVNFLLSPKVEIGDYSDVRLQYRRWLNVEDAFFDKGNIYSNSQLVWTNFNSDSENSSSVHHQDREWRFHDVSLAGTGEDGSVQIKYEIDSDGGLEFGGWTIDDFCIVANANAICGDSTLYGTEQCDNGDQNSDTAADACRSDCLAASCGDGVLDTGESCDDGNNADGDGCQATCLFASEDTGDCGCVVGASRPWRGQHSALVLIGLVGLFAIRRRRYSK